MQDVKPLLKEACAAVFGDAAGLVDMMVRHFPSSKAGSAMKARKPALSSLTLRHSTCSCASPLSASSHLRSGACILMGCARQESCERAAASMLFRCKRAVPAEAGSLHAAAWWHACLASNGDSHHACSSA
jgi:hypothetical protein